jgi:4'-phosphopantetheinyl transferase
MRLDDVHHLWTPCFGTPELHEHEAHIWSASLNVSDAQLKQMRAVLSRDEILRSERSPLIEERHRFTVSRGVLRHVLAPYVGVDARDIQFAYGHAGKPYLIDNTGNIHFNMSHSGDLALVAVTRSREIGVDVEKLCDMPEMDDIVVRFFSDSAKAEFQSAPIAERVQVFFRCWTEREAISKCTGDGIADDKPLPVEGISVIPLLPAIGYVGSLAINGPALKLRTWNFAAPASADKQSSCDAAPAEAATANGRFL